MKKGVVNFLIAFIFTTSFIVPVHALGSEIETIAIPPESYAAYMYWFNHGYSSLYETGIIENSQSSVTLSITGTNSNGTSIGSITGCLTVPAGSQNNTAYNLTTGCNYSQTQPINLTIGNGNTTVNESVSGSNNSLNSIFYNYKLPWLTGSYYHSSAYDYNHSILVNSTDWYYMIFYADKSIYNADGTVKIYQEDPSVQLVVNNGSSPMFGNFIYYRFAFKLKSGQQRITLDFPKIVNDVKIIPIYNGTTLGLTNETRSAYGIDTTDVIAINEQTNVINNKITETNDLMSTGNNTSSAAGNLVNNTNNNLSDGVSDLEGYESQFNSDLNISLNRITLPDVNGVTKFGNAARWVSEQYTRIANDQRINFPLIFCLTLGLALTILGRIRT